MQARNLQLWPPWLLSLVIHLSIVVVAGLAHWFVQSPRVKNKKVDFEVIQFPKAQPTLTIQNPPAKPVAPAVPEQRQVFGLSRKAITSDSAPANSAEIKAGNTVAKEMDDLALRKDDADSLPIPADEFLVESMPVQLNESKVPYPEEDRRASVEGPVLMNLLIDATGKVRQVEVISGPSSTLMEAARAGAFQFQFRPAKIKGESVPVKIRYTYRFVLEAQ